jgi:hypothetical protein
MVSYPSIADMEIWLNKYGSSSIYLGADGSVEYRSMDFAQYERRARELDDAHAEVARLTALINHPHTDSFLDAVRLEAAHQRERWAAEHDAGKTDADWFWLVGYLAGKALSKPEKLLHHIVTTAAALLNWHMARTVGNRMRPGIAEPT